MYESFTIPWRWLVHCIISHGKDNLTDVTWSENLLINSNHLAVALFNEQDYYPLASSSSFFCSLCRKWEFIYWTEERKKRELIKFLFLRIHTYTYGMVWMWEQKEQRRSERERERNVRVMIVNLLAEKEGRSNRYMDKCVSRTSYATLGGMSDHHYVFLCYLTE